MLQINGSCWLAPSTTRSRSLLRGRSLLQAVVSFDKRLHGLLDVYITGPRRSFHGGEEHKQVQSRSPALDKIPCYYYSPLRASLDAWVVPHTVVHQRTPP